MKRPPTPAIHFDTKTAEVPQSAVLPEMQPSAQPAPQPDAQPAAQPAAGVTARPAPPAGRGDDVETNSGIKLVGRLIAQERLDQALTARSAKVNIRRLNAKSGSEYDLSRKGCET